jgi:hypothetical protein
MQTLDYRIRRRIAPDCHLERSQQYIVDLLGEPPNTPSPPPPSPICVYVGAAAQVCAVFGDDAFPLGRLHQLPARHHAGQHAGVHASAAEVGPSAPFGRHH